MNLPVTDADFSSLEGSRCYCSSQTAEAIRGIVSKADIRSIHLLGSGDRHYVTLFHAELIREPFTLVLMDNHPDDQPAAFGDDVLSCGSWMRDVRSLSLCRGTLWYDGKGTTHQTGEIAGKIYLSIDLDILDSRFFTTDWDQGTLTPEDLYSAVRLLACRHELLGVDICGAPDAARRMMTCELNANSTVLRNLLKILNETDFRS